MIHLWGAPLALGAAFAAGASLPALGAAGLVWALALLVAPLRLVLLLIAPLALAVGLGAPRGLLDALATVAAALLALAPLLAYLGGAPTPRQLLAGASIAAGTGLAMITPWAAVLLRSDLAAGATTLTLAGVSLLVFAALFRYDPARPRA